MTDFVLATPSEKQAWSKKVTNEYVRESGLKPYTSADGKGIFNVVVDLKDAEGTIVHCPLIAKLRGAGNDGTTPLVNNEDVLANYSIAVRTKQVRNAVAIPLNQKIKTEMDLYGASRMALTNWLAEKLRTDLLTELQSIPVAGTGGGLNPEDTSLPISTTNDAAKNAFMVANADRILVGSLKSNAGTVFATSVAKVATTDKMSAKIVKLARKVARTTTNSSKFAVQPYKTASGQEWYVMFVDSNGFRDAAADPEIFQANKDARPRESDIKDNPLFSGDYLTYMGVIIREIPELSVLTGAGAGGINVGVAALCGIQAVNLAYNFMAQPTKRNETDYDNVQGVGVREFRGQQKCSIGGTQTGMVTVFHASQDDA